MEFDESVNEDVRRRTRPVRYLPSYASSYWMWYKGRYVTISRTKEESRWNPDKSTLEITLVSSVFINWQSLKASHRIYSRDRSILDSLIREARQHWLAARSDKIDIYASEGSVRYPYIKE